MLDGIVELASEATDCHACFIYMLEDGELTMRAASPVYAHAVGNVRMGLDEGLAGWVARRQTPEFIRDQAMDDPRMKFFPILEEERFQSMAAVPILSRSKHTIGVIVLHTEAPREFGDDTLTLLEHIASLVSGAIENAQLYGQQRRRVDALTRLSALAEELATARTLAGIGEAVTRAAQRLLGASVCALHRLDGDGGELELLACVPASAIAAPAPPATALLLAALEGAAGPPAHSLWPELDVKDLLVAPLRAGGEQVGLLSAGAPARHPFTDEDREMARAVAHLAAIAIKRVELIETLTQANAVNDLFEALAADATAFAAAKAAEVGCELSQPYLVVYAEPTDRSEQASESWPATAELVARRLSRLAAQAAVEPGPGPVRALLGFGGHRPRVLDGAVAACQELGRDSGTTIGVSERHDAPAEAARAYREAVDAATIGRALLPKGGAIGYAEVGAYRYLVHISAENAPHDRMQTAVDTLIAYDARRRTSLLDTLERYLADGRSVIRSARALFIHPNTLRQRLSRIEELTGLELERDDLLSLELAIKLARLHGRPAARP